jgi:hypothetical protein
MSDLNKIRNEVKKADAEMKQVKEINYHKYNNFVMHKTLEFNEAMKRIKERHTANITEDSAKEATKQFKMIQNGKTSFGFEGLDRIEGFGGLDRK